MNFLELLNRRQFERDTTWEEARRVMVGGGGIELMKNIAIELKKKADDTAIVMEYDKGVNIDSFYVLALRWDLRKRRFLDESGTWWDSRGVALKASPIGGISAGLTWQNSWHDLDDRTGPRSRILDIEEFLNSKTSLEEQVRLAMRYAQMHPDYRFGQGDKGLRKRVVKGKDSKRIF